MSDSVCLCEVIMHRKLNKKSKAVKPYLTEAAWEFYKTIHKDDVRVEYSSYLSLNKYLTVKSDEIELFANRDFSFNKNISKKSGIKTNYFKYRTIIKGASVENKEELSRKLEKCRNMYDTLLNFSIFPKTGSMIRSAGALRFDIFLNKLRVFYTYGTSIMNLKLLDDYIEFSKTFPTRLDVTSTNAKTLYLYLTEFKDIYEYCDKHYFTDKDYVDKLLDFYDRVNEENGHRYLENVDQVSEYIDLALEYWKIRYEKFSEIYGNKCECEKCIELLNM